jgi:hypothetical protein
MADAFAGLADLVATERHRKAMRAARIANVRVPVVGLDGDASASRVASGRVRARR